MATLIGTTTPRLLAAFTTLAMILASSALTVLLLALQVSPALAAIGTVNIGNDFRIPTLFTCTSNTRTRPPYAASSSEIYYFAFDTTRHQFWDCAVENKAYARSGKFRFWADDAHGGPALFNCVNYQWSVDQFAISMYVNSKWHFHYFWHDQSKP